jgi:hypothetical protein
VQLKLAVAAALTLALAGCGGSPAPTHGTLHAAFSDVNGANTSAAPLLLTIDCTYDPVDQLLSCGGDDGQGRAVSVSVVGGVAAGQSYAIAANQPMHGDVAYQDSGSDGGVARQWQAVDGVGAVSVTSFDGKQVVATFSASLMPVAGDLVAMGSFTLSGDLTAPVTTLK